MDPRMARFLHAADARLDSPPRGFKRREGAPVDGTRSAARLTNRIDRELEPAAPGQPR